MEIPIIVICYNNYQYVENTLNQIIKINKRYYDNIQILDNCSTCEETIHFLNNVNCKVIRNSSNTGPWVTPSNNKHIYDSMPDKFILTDPDLEFNKNLPENFIDILSDLSEKHKTLKIGFALEIIDFDKMFDFPYYNVANIYEWEKKYWVNRIKDETFELYDADIDTTFCLVNKNSAYKTQIRVAGKFTARHIPWYRENTIINNIYKIYITNTKTTSFSSITKRMMPYIENHFLKIHKNDEFFFIEKRKDPDNIPFWSNTYFNWENLTFRVFDTFLNKNKVFIDIGGWIGTTCMYACRKSKHVYSIEADKQSFGALTVNCKNNCEPNSYTLISNAIYNVDDMDIKFGKNKFMKNSRLNDSTSQTYTEEESTDQCYSVKTITLQSVFNKYNINPLDVSLIKIDIEGGEEFVLEDLFAVHKTYNIPLYVRFHVEWWKDKNLNRFDFLSENNKEKINKNPFISILFE